MYVITCYQLHMEYFPQHLDVYPYTASYCVCDYSINGSRSSSFTPAKARERYETISETATATTDTNLKTVATITPDIYAQYLAP